VAASRVNVANSLCGTPWTHGVHDETAAVLLRKVLGDCPVFPNFGLPHHTEIHKKTGLVPHSCLAIRWVPMSQGAPDPFGFMQVERGTRNRLRPQALDATAELVQCV
jgi:hypothetical protein